MAEQPLTVTRPNVSNTRFVLAAVAIEASLGVAALVGGRFIGPDPLATLSWSWKAFATGVAATLPPILGLFELWQSKYAPFARIRQILESSLLRDLSKLRLAQLTIIAIAAGIGEEMLFRGFLQGLLESSLGAPAGLALASVIFGLAHPITFAYFVIAATMGLYFGLLWWWTGNLLAPVIAHSLYDFLAILWMTANRDSRDS
jgi:membrane protease YdiL (CAAX protease family)